MIIWQLIYYILQLYLTQNSLDCEKVIREGINKYVDEVGNLWSKLAEYNIKLGKFDKARSIYEEGFQNVVTARDFGIIYSSYLKLEEELL